MKLIECFRTWQGEGPDRGRSVLLLRFKTCNLNCPWCDTAVKMRVLEEAEYELKQLQEIVDKHKCGLLITGGEPTVKKHFMDTVQLLNCIAYPFANVETNGHDLLKLTEQIDLSKNPFIKYIFSPKFFSEQDLTDAMQETEKLEKISNVYIKIVYDNSVFTRKYIEWIAGRDLNQRVYIMPEGATQAVLLSNAPSVFDACEKYRFNFTSRDHIIFGFI